MKAQKLTPKQKEIFDLLSSLPNAVLYRHVKPTGVICYRLLDEKRNPLLNVRMSFVEQLIEKDVLEKSGHEYILKATTDNKMDLSKLGLANVH